MNLDYEPGQTPLDADEATGLIPGHIATQGDLDEWEQTNILQAQRWLMKLRNPDVLSEAFCRELHRRMFNRTWRWAGQFRQSDKNIGCAWPQVPVRLRQLLDNTAHQIAAGTVDFDETLARFHHQLVLVHPFPNGNGRHARLMVDTLQRRAGGAALSWGGGDAVVAAQSRRHYIEALRAADAGDLQPLRAFLRS